MKKWLLLWIGIALLCGCEQAKQPSKDESVDKAIALMQLEPVKSGDLIATMNTSKGTIKIRLFPGEAPKAVENFVTHAQAGYYDNLTFHRVIADFMIQSGDPKGNGTGGESIWGTAFEDEFSDVLFHFNGALAMANSGKDSNGSQFFIVQNHDGSAYNDDYFDRIYAQAQAKNWTNAGYEHPSNVKETYREVGGVPYLDHQHTVFGQVIEGMDVVDEIANVQTGAKDKPVDDILILSITITEVE